MNIVANLGAEQRAAYQKLENTNSNYFITGKAGTGKSVLLSYFVAHTKKNIAVVAPTGVAAINVGGFTIHSFFQLEPTFQDCLDKKKVRDINDKQANIISELDAIVIDEISMVSADLLDMIDAKLRFIKNQREEPFGGCQIIMFGDPFQLPPIPPRGDALKLMEARYNSTFFFSSLVMADLPFETIGLNHIYRQTDDDFIRILNKIRVGDIDFEMINSLNKRCLHEDSDDTVITLASTNRISDQINELNLNMLPGQIYNFQANIVGDIKRSDYPAPDALSLREGAHVMMLKNDRP
ncbi:AAA family ATPase, partial [Candidatus Saccharibacteria bacterium]|nr:AAA family ATPase [Candidatus Saccharibacteria bacterium]